MENLPVRVPQTLFPDLVSAFFIPAETPPDAVIELVITIEGEHIPAREFAAYLALIDRVYGRLDPEGLRSYAHRDEGRLQITEIHKSDLEIIFRVLYGYQDTATYIVILLFLKSLPNMFKIATEGVKNLADAYKSYEEGRTAREERIHKEAMEVANRYSDPRRREAAYQEVYGRLARINRKQIREIVNEEPALERLDDTRKSQLISLLAALVKEENPNLPSPIRFARHQVKNILLRVRRPNPPDTYKPHVRKVVIDDDEI